MSDQSSSKYSQLRQAADVGSVGLEMGVSAAIGCYGGMWLDEQWGTEPWMLTLGMIAGFGAAFKAILRTAKKAKAAMQDSSDEYTALREDEKSSE